jgi:hypothetical protein
MIPSASTVPTTQLGSTVAASLDPLIIGIWVSPDSVVDTYAVDGTVVTVGSTTLTRTWRVGGDAVEIGTVNKAGNFVRDGEPRHVGRDAAGNVVSIGESKRATTLPTTSSLAH